MQKVNVLNLERISAMDRAKIAAIDPTVNLTNAEGWFDGEYRDTWPAYSSARFLLPGVTGSGTREERDRLLADADVVLGGWLPARSACQGTEAQMVSSAARGRQQSAEGRSVGQRRDCDHHTRFG